MQAMPTQEVADDPHEDTNNEDEQESASDSDSDMDDHKKRISTTKVMMGRSRKQPPRWHSFRRAGSLNALKNWITASM